MRYTLYSWNDDKVNVCVASEVSCCGAEAVRCCAVYTQRPPLPYKPNVSKMYFLDFAK